MARRTRPEAPSLARTRSAAPAVGILLGYAAPELSAWVSANREAVLRAAEAVDAAYIAAVDALAPRLPGGEGAWERASATLTIYDSESEEHRARKPSRIENVEGWQSRVADKHGKREVLALLPVRLPASEGFVARLDNRWVSGHGSDRVWTLTTAWPSPETPLELAGYEMRRRGVDVSQQTGEERGGGSTMPTLDAAHNALLQAYRIEARNPFRASGLNFGAGTVGAMLHRWKFPAAVKYAVVWEHMPGISTPPRFHRPSQVKAVRDALVAEGLIVPDQKAWAYAPVEPFPSREAYRAALAELVAGL